MNFAGGLQSITQIVLSELLRQIKKPMRIQMRCGNIVRTFLFLLAIFQAGPVSAKLASIEIPCVEFSSAFNLPCLCSLNEVNATRINCDNVVFPGDFPVLPRQYYIQADMETEFSGIKHLKNDKLKDIINFHQANHTRACNSGVFFLVKRAAPFNWGMCKQVFFGHPEVRKPGGPSWNVMQTK